MFYRYGFFSLSVRVVPRDDPGRWIVREPTADIFDAQSVVKTEVAGPNTFAKQSIQVLYHGIFSYHDYNFFFRQDLTLFFALHLIMSLVYLEW